VAHVLLGDFDADRGNSADAARHYQDSLCLWHETQSRELLTETIRGAGLLAASDNRLDTAVRLLAASTAMGTNIGYAKMAAHRPRIDPALSLARASLGDDVFSEAWSAGDALPLDAVLEEAHEVLVELSATSSRSPSRSPAVPGGLTPRELDVVRLIAAGRSNREIAQKLFVSQSTANTHVHHILAKLELDSRSGVAAWAVRNGFD
jgi:DNA-binding NarL/FixJ family response regulator